jgi:hypothetical protein
MTDKTTEAMTNANLPRTENAFLRAVGDASQEADKLRNFVNSGRLSGRDLEERVACFVLAAARVKNIYNELD